MYCIHLNYLLNATSFVANCASQTETRNKKYFHPKNQKTKNPFGLSKIENIPFGFFIFLILHFSDNKHFNGKAAIIWHFIFMNKYSKVTLAYLIYFLLPNYSVQELFTKPSEFVILS